MDNIINNNQSSPETTPEDHLLSALLLSGIYSHSSNLTFNCPDHLPFVDTSALLQDYDENALRYRALYFKLQFVTGLICYPVFCALGLAGNILSLVVLSHRKMKSSTNTYLQALAVSDSVKLLNDGFYFLTILSLHVDHPTGQQMYAHLYPYAHYFFNASVCVTAWLTVSVAAERYILVCHATRAKRICSQDRARAVSIAVFVSMSVLTVPLGLRYRTVEVCNPLLNATQLDVEVTELWRNKTFVAAYQWLQNLLRSIIPLIILCALNYFIIQALRRTRSTKKKMSARHRITLMLVSVIVVFLVCVTPDAIMSTFFGFGYYDADYLVRAVREITDLLLLINSAVNFVLYCTFNKLFRRQFMDVFCRCAGWPSRQFVKRPSELLGEYKQTSLATTFRPTCRVFHSNDKDRRSTGNKDDDETPPLFENEELCFEATAMGDDRFPQEEDDIVVCHGSSVVNNTSTC